ncbi:MAG: YdeI/OmpD-associated family protein [Bacteroidota bacterium]
MTQPPVRAELPILRCKDQKSWSDWLGKHHGSSTGIWLQIAKKGSDQESPTYAEAVEAALCHGWIDGQKDAYDKTFWLQKFTPRKEKSIWSKINRGKAEELLREGKMTPAGRKAIDQAKHNGQWGKAYSSQSRAKVPADLQRALDRAPRAKAFFATLKSVNRYAILFRIQTAKKPETRERRIRDFIAMLVKHETIHP